LTVIILENNNIGDQGANRLWDTLKVHNGTLIEVALFGDTNDLQGYINFLVNANKNGKRIPPPCPRTTSELFVEALQSLKTDDGEVSIVLQLEATLQFMSDFFQLSLFYTTVSANYKLGVLDVNERNRLVHQALEIARKWCISAQRSAVYQVFLDKAKLDEMISPYAKNEFEKLASETQIENSAFIKKMKQDIHYNAARNSDMERGIKKMCGALGEEFQRLRSTMQMLNRNVQQLNRNVQRLKYETDMMGEAVNAVQHNVEMVQHNVEVVDKKVNKMKKAMVRKKQVESGVAFLSIILNAVTFGSAGPTLQVLANLKALKVVGHIVDFSDMEHVRKVLKSETIEAIESPSASDVIDWTLETAGDKFNEQFDKAIETQDSVFMITTAATMLAQGYEIEIEKNIEASEKNIEASVEIEINIEASDVVFPKNAHCFDAHERDLKNKTKVFEASMDPNDFENKQLCVFTAILYGHIEDLKNELSEDNVDLKALDSRKRTCADFAAVMGRLDMVQLILDQGGKFEVMGRPIMINLARERDQLNKE
jgi:archaellum component FlaC